MKVKLYEVWDCLRQRLGGGVERLKKSDKEERATFLSNRSYQYRAPRKLPVERCCARKAN